MTEAKTAPAQATLPTDITELHRMVTALRSVVAQYAEREQVYLRALDQLVAPSNTSGYVATVDKDEDVTDAVGEVFELSPCPVAVYARDMAS